MKKLLIIFLFGCSSSKPTTVPVVDSSRAKGIYKVMFVSKDGDTTFLKTIAE